MFLVYSLLFMLGFVVALPYLLWRYRGRRLPAGYFRERLGFLPGDLGGGPDPAAGRAIWVHAVSVGETLAAVGLVKKMARRHAGRPIYLSNVTPAGREAGASRLPDLAGRFYLPLDWRWAVGRVVRRIRPGALVIVETELWPNLLRVVHRSGARVFLVNARLSERSFRGYRRFRFFWKRVLREFDAIFAQTAADADRFRALGATAERVRVGGNLKFDSKPPELGRLPSQLQQALGSGGRGPVVVAASTMPGEESLFLGAWDQIRARHPQAFLILAPRHPDRFEQVAELLRGSGRAFARRTALETNGQDLAAQVADLQILLLNTIGELGGIFAIADLVFVGGSLVPTGGHNLIEPAFWAKPILFGPFMHNFRDTAELFLEARAALQVEDASALARESLRVLGDADLARGLGSRAEQVLKRESGATERILAEMEKLGL